MSLQLRRQLFTHLLLASILIAILPSSSSMDRLEDSTTEAQFLDSDSDTQIQGQSFLNFTDTISPNSQVNATWFAEITIPDSYGTDLLENRSMGLLGQIDAHLGNSDGWLDAPESQEFSNLVVSSRNWSDSGSGGCCSFDYNPMDVIGQMEILVTPPETGPINRTDGNWGWSESAVISGVSDGRTLRLIDVPRAGALIEEVPLTINLPDDWEFRYSPMSEVISGFPGLFTVNRSQAPVAYDIRITITQNTPPIISAARYPSSSSAIPLDKTTSFAATCIDSPLDSPVIQWTVSKEGEVIASYQNPWFEVVPNEIGLSHGDVMSVNATCSDFHGESSHWHDNPSIDGVIPVWTGAISIGESSKAPLDPTNLSPILAPAGSKITLEVNSSDDSSLPVLLELFTNISEGWRQSGDSQHSFEFTVNQGLGINGADMGIHERHLERKPTEISVALLVTDDAGNSAIGEWVVRVLDSNSPTVIPRFYSNEVEIEIGDGIHENDELQLDLSPSFDDLDPIDNVTWSIWIDDIELIWDVQNWSVLDPIEVSPLTQGIHEISVKATDSKGNLREENVSITVEPKSGVFITVVEATLSGDSKVGSTATLTVIVQNDGSDPAFARVCLSDICGRWTEQPFSSSLQTGPEQRVIEFQFEMENDSVEGLYLNWDSASAGTNGQITIDVSFEDEEENSPFYILVLLVIASSIYLVYNMTRVEGPE